MPSITFGEERAVAPGLGREERLLRKAEATILQNAALKREAGDYARLLTDLART
jgi:hypothetical protein